MQEQLKIFLQKEEDVFEKYGDEEAEMYYMIQKMEKEQEEKRKAEREQERANQRGNRDRDNKDRGDRDNRKYNNKKNYDRDNKNNHKKQEEETATKEDAEALGFKFNSNGPPRFQNSKKQNSVAEESKEQNLREVIETR